MQTERQGHSHVAVRDIDLERPPGLPDRLVVWARVQLGRDRPCDVRVMLRRQTDAGEELPDRPPQRLWSEGQPTDDCVSFCGRFSPAELQGVGRLEVCAYDASSRHDDGRREPLSCLGVPMPAEGRQPG